MWMRMSTRSPLKPCIVGAPPLSGIVVLRIQAQLAFYVVVAEQLRVSAPVDERLELASCFRARERRLELGEQFFGLQNPRSEERRVGKECISLALAHLQHNETKVIHYLNTNV